MRITSRVKAWDYLRDSLRSLTTYGSLREPSVAEIRLRESLQRLYEMPLPIAAIIELAELVRSVQILIEESD